MFFRLLKEGFIFAVNSIFVNKLRTFLSLFGITIGIFSIISVFTVLDWMEKSIRDTVSSLGDNVIYVQKFPWTFDPNWAWWDIIKWPSISDRDYQAILKKSTKSETACFAVFQPEKIKYRKNIASDVTVGAITIEFQNIRSFEIDKGRYFSPFEASSGKNVALIGAEIAEKLFEKADPVGKPITIAGFKTTVIGVLKKEGKGGISDNGLDGITLVPLNFGRSFINMRNRFIEAQLMIKAKPGVAIQELSDETTMILRAARSLRPKESSNFSVNRASMLSKGLDAIFVAINIGGWIIGGFSILVGGFGIANIMFVSVRERTNIIGIQKALGAKRFFILQQFLVESVLLSTIGGLLGVFMIFLTTLVINYLYDLNMYLTLANVLLAVFISGIIGVVAGYAPANTAAKMNPVEAIGFSF
ncbi:MAG: FtsX-like permease family protein [Bacteroidetes bacterium]|nr:MAG: FtsX-like permease family protein [Bacteroidota bacterium]